MTIDETIEHFRITEKDSRQEATNIESNLYLPKSIDRDRLVTECNIVAETNKQIAEWLEELKMLRVQVAELQCERQADCAFMAEHDKVIYNDALDDAIRILEKRSELGECEYSVIERIEKLKRGV